MTTLRVKIDDILREHDRMRAAVICPTERYFELLRDETWKKIDDAVKEQNEWNVKMGEHAKRMVR